MKAGELRHRGTIQRPVVTANSHGESDTTWRTYAARVPMQVVQQNSRALWNAQQIQPDVTCLVRMRWVEGVTCAMRIVWHDGATDRYLNIDNPPTNPDGRRLELNVACVETK
jgi:head-tail adaptor